MSSSENEDNAKRIYQQLEPLCLFFCPYDNANYGIEEESYVSEKKEKKWGKEESEKFGNRKRKVQREKQEMWLRRRRELNMKRKKRMLEASRHLKNYLLMSGEAKPAGGHQKVYVPYLVEGLETVKDAWPPNEILHNGRYLDENETFKSSASHKYRYTMIEDKTSTLPLSTRRSSMPEEYMRRYFLKKMVPSEESETNQTVPDASSVSSKDFDGGSAGEIPDSTSTKKETQVYDGKKKLHTTSLMNVLDETVHSNGKNRDVGMKRVTQNEYDNQGKGIIKMKTKEMGSQTGRFSARSETSATGKEDTEISRTSESWTSSSPVELPRQDISTSGNLSSESEEVKCTCAELSSKETSTDIYRSGNSTLSQTVSEKSVSTQDSTISLHSVSTGGSTLSTNSNSSSPEVFTRTSAKETSSPEHTHREKIKRPQFRSFHRIFRRGYPKFLRKRPYCRRHYRRRRICYEISEEKETKSDCSGKENCEVENALPPSWRETPTERQIIDQEVEKSEDQNATEISTYEWMKYTPEEIYMMQQMRHRKFIENYRRFSVPLPATPDTRSISVCATKGSVYRPSEDVDDRILIPRYSALPRTLSMIVNTSSGDTSAINSDSDSVSLADSLEEFPVVHMHKISYDTKKELKPVRGDVNAALDAEKKVKRRQSRAKAFFVSIKEPYGEDELLSGITKIPEPPQKIKERINERQLNILHLRKKNLERKRDDNKRKGRSEIRRKNVRTRERSRQKKEESSSENPEGNSDVGYRNFTKGENRKLCQELSTLKTQAHSVSVSTNKKKVQNHQKTISRKDKGTRKKEESGGNCTGYGMHASKVVHIAEQLEVNAVVNGAVTVNSSLAKPQAVIHPSLMPTSEPEILRRTAPASQPRPYRYRQKFEVIPEEKSSSMSSTDENKTVETNKKTFLPIKKTDTLALPESQKKYTFGNVSNIVFAKFMGKSLRACMHKDSTSERPIILLSPKAAEAGGNTCKGRDALIALNREDFNRLSKGWMNFYLLKETSDASESSVQEEKEDHKEKDKNVGCTQKDGSSDPKEKSEAFGDEKSSHFVITEKQENLDLTSPNVNREWRNPFKDGEQESVRKKVLNDKIKFHSSNTVLKPIKITPRKTENRLSLPELNVSSSITTAPHQQSLSQNQDLVLPKVPQKSSEYDEMDSDSTVYCQPPSTIVPRLTFCDSGDSEGSVSNSESDEMTTLPLKSIPPRKRESSRRARPKREVLRRDSKDYSGWSVTVAGTLELSAAAPDLEMRLSFPGNGCGPPQAIRSDSGFVEDGLRSREPPFGDSVTSDGNRKQRWTVTVQNPKQGYREGTERKASRNHILPDLGQAQSRNLKKVLKSRTLRNEETDGKISILWPKLEVRRDDWIEKVVNEEELSVRGNAIPMEKKPRPPTMSERDLTRGLTARSNNSDSKYSKNYFGV